MQSESDLDKLFQGLKESSREKTYGDKIMEEIEREYKKPREEMNEREKEKISLNLQLSKLNKKLSKNKNIKNAAASINQGRADARKKVRAEIERVKDRLYEIEIEERGSNISSSSLVDSTIRQTMKKV